MGACHFAFLSFTLGRVLGRNGGVERLLPLAFILPAYFGCTWSTSAITNGFVALASEFRLHLPQQELYSPVWYHLEGSSSTTTTTMAEPSSPSVMPQDSRSCHSTPRRKRVVSSHSYSHSASYHRQHHHHHDLHEHTRPSSRSTMRSGPGSRRSSQHSLHHRLPTTGSLTPSVHSRCRPEQRRENLLALHRESCRLFQGPDAHSSRPATMSRAHTTGTTIRSLSTASSEIGSPPVSPGLYAHSSTSERSFDGPNSIYHAPDTVRPEHGLASRKEPSATVIDWTSQSTRRREYEKIDRASRGVRGLWRRVAPQWCQSKNERMPFFDPGKSGKACRDGSVRRFRMDLPDDHESSQRKITFRRGENRRHTAG